MSRPKRGVVVGKFYPPHAGHHHLIQTALLGCNELTVIVCDAPNEAPGAAQRAEWLRQLHPSAHVVVTPDDIPNAPEPWAARTIEIMRGRPDVVFTSEDYGPGYAAEMQARHVFVDPERSAFPISGTRVRAHPLASWEYLRGPVRAHYAVRIVLVGAESTGKTTLTQDLAGHFQTNWVRELGRDVTEELYDGPVEPVPIGGPSPWTEEDFVKIAVGQQALEDNAAQGCNKVLFCDTNAFATMIWSERYLGRIPGRVRQIGEAAPANLYLLTAPDLPFTQDGFRDGEFIRDWMHQRFLNELRSHNYPFEIISGFGPARIDKAVETVRVLLDRILL